STISPDLDNTVKQLNKTFAEITPKINQTFAKMNLLLDNTNKLVGTATETMNAGKGIIADPRLKENLLATTSNFQAVSAEARITAKQLSKDLREVVASSKGNLNTLT